MNGEIKQEVRRLRAKVRVSEVIRGINSGGGVDYERVKLQAVYSNEEGSENAQWSKWTPSAQIDITINNPDAFGRLTNGHEYYLDFSVIE